MTEGFRASLSSSSLKLIGDFQQDGRFATEVVEVLIDEHGVVERAPIRGRMVPKNLRAIRGVKLGPYGSESTSNRPNNVDHSSPRGLGGAGTISAEWCAGFRVEVEARRWIDKIIRNVKLNAPIARKYG